MKFLQDLRFIPKPYPFLQIPPAHPLNCTQFPVFGKKSQSFSIIPTTHLPNSTKYHVPAIKIKSFLRNVALLTSLSYSLPSYAAETEQVSDKINIESILISIDDFFNRYPFFAASCAFVWLVVLPLTEEYLKKCKFISAIDAFRKLSDLPNSQLLDIRKEQSINYLSSPNLKVLKKSVVQVEFVEGEEESFVKEVMKKFGDPGNTVLCILDNFDGNSLKAAELLYKNGFKEAYAIKDGLRGKNGWQAIQETLLPPSVHVYPNKKKRKSSVKVVKENEKIDAEKSSNGYATLSSSIKQKDDKISTEIEKAEPMEVPLEAKLSVKVVKENEKVDVEKSSNGYATLSSSIKQKDDKISTEIEKAEPMEVPLEAKLANGKSNSPLSPYPMYPDLKPPSSPTPSKPQH